MRAPIVLALCCLLTSCISSAQDFNDHGAPSVTVTHSPPALSQPRRRTGLDLLDGDAVRLQLPKALSSSSVKVGDVVTLRAEQEVKLGGLVIVAQGASAQATVTDVRHRGQMGKDGRIDIRIDSVELVTGERIPLRAVAKARGAHAGDVGTAAALTAIDPVDAAVVWPILPFLRGDEVEMPEGTKIIAFIAGDHPLDPKAFNLPLVSITSQPDGAEIFVDSTRIGETPLTRVLTAGDHAIQIKAAGYQPWQRTLTVIGGTVTVSAELQPIAP